MLCVSVPSEKAVFLTVADVEGTGRAEAVVHKYMKTVNTEVGK